MRGSCILSAGILIVIAGMTSSPPPPKHHPMDLAAIVAMVSPAYEPIDSTTVREPYKATLPSFSARQESCPPVAGESCKVIYPQPIDYYLANDRDLGLVKKLVSRDHRSRLFIKRAACCASGQYFIDKYLERKPSQGSTGISRTRVVRLPELSPGGHTDSSIARLLPAIDRLLEALAIEVPGPEHHASDPAADTRASWMQAPYFQKYGYQYVMDEKSESEDRATDLSDDTEDWTEAPYLQRYGYEHLLEETPEATDTAVTPTPTPETDPPKPSPTSPSRLTVPEFVSNPIDGTIGPDEGEEDNEAGFAYADDYLADEEGLYPDGYPIEYEAYEETMPDEEVEATEVEVYDISSPSTEEDLSPSTSEGSFDIYWEETDPNVY